MRKLSFFIFFVFISCNYKIEQKETKDKAEVKTTAEDPLNESEYIPAYPPNEFEKFGKAFLNLIYKKDTNKVREHLLDTLIDHDEYSKISIDSFINKMYESPFDSFLLSNIKNQLNIHYTQENYKKGYFNPKMRAKIDDTSVSDIVLINESSEKKYYNLTILTFIHTKKGFQLYRYSVLPYD